MRILTILGARPQFIKAAMVSRAFHALSTQHSNNKIEEIIVHTGQHYDKNMSAIFFTEMGIPEPKYTLGIGGSSHGAMTGKMLEKIDSVIQKEKPDIVLVYGDTNSTLAGALSAVKLHIPVAHVESGLRSFDFKNPEEVNRVLTDRISHWLFCPTDTAVSNLKNEGMTDAYRSSHAFPFIQNVGDVMFDAALYFKKRAKPSSSLSKFLKSNPSFYIATLHRAENTDDEKRLLSIMEALNKVSQSESPVLLPLHPRTRKLLQTHVKKNNKIGANIKIIDPVGYFDMLLLLDACEGVFTDSGGLQKEAYFFRKPCALFLPFSPWVELVDNGYAILVDADKDKISDAWNHFMSKALPPSKPLFGSGKTAMTIGKILLKR